MWALVLWSIVALWRMCSKFQFEFSKLGKAIRLTNWLQSSLLHTYLYIFANSKSLELKRKKYECLYWNMQRKEEICHIWMHFIMTMHSNAKVIYPLFIKRASLNKKGIDFLSIRNFAPYRMMRICTIFFTIFFTLCSVFGTLCVDYELYFLWNECLIDFHIWK